MYSTCGEFKGQRDENHLIKVNYIQNFYFNFPKKFLHKKIKINSRSNFTILAWIRSRLYDFLIKY